MKLPRFDKAVALDWADGGRDLGQSIALYSRLKTIGIDLIDVSSGGVVPKARISVGKGYQVPFACKIREESERMTGAVGPIADARHADEIIASGDADLVFLGRELKRGAK